MLLRRMWSRILWYHIGLLLENLVPRENNKRVVVSTTALRIRIFLTDDVNPLAAT